MVANDGWHQSRRLQTAANQSFHQSRRLQRGGNRGFHQSRRLRDGNNFGWRWFGVKVYDNRPGFTSFRPFRHVEQLRRGQARCARVSSDSVRPSVRPAAES